MITDSSAERDSSSGITLAVWCALLAVVLWTLNVLGQGPLEAPPASPRAWDGWITRTGPETAVVALIRLGAQILVTYLVVVTVAGAVARRGRNHHAARILDRVSPRLVQRILAGATGLSISAAGLAVAVAPTLAPRNHERTATAAEPAEIASLKRVRHLSQPFDPITSGDVETASIAVLEIGFAPIAADTGEKATRPVIEPGHLVDLWRVEAGDSFWSIAHDHLSDMLGTPEASTVTSYWWSLIDANRAVLVDPTNPDLIYPGQVFSLPPLPGSTTESAQIVGE